ncbi:helix-turn-helix domain-containing protein [Bacillus sp. AP8]|nr:helix-turn-helix domain-containing protein [Bacillus sp. AP8]
MRDKLRYFGCQSAKVIKYICAKLRKYRGEFFESNKTIAEACEVSVRTVQNAIKRAEKLEIFVVSERTELTFNDKMRRTSNLIHLLPYQAKEVVRKVVSVARKVGSVLRNKTTKSANRRFVRTEPVPDWLGKEQSNPKLSEEDKAQIADLKALLRDRYSEQSPQSARKCDLIRTNQPKV